jgi:hypothetical protein
MKYRIIIKSICFEMALVVSMTTDVVHSFISRISFIYLLGSYCISVCCISFRTEFLSVDMATSIKKHFSFFLFFTLVYFSRYQRKVKQVSHHVSLCVSSINTTETNTRFLSLQLLRQTSKIPTNVT